jgi:8-hydroxy-5-deazaflavin:NADPH oxidoreductase
MAWTIEGTPASVVVIDTGNYYPRQRDGRVDEIETGMLESRWVELQLRRPVVKTFNSTGAKFLESKHSIGEFRRHRLSMLR